MIRNIVFDMGQVLIRWEPELFLDRLEVPEEDRPAFVRATFRSVEWVQLDRGVLTPEEAAALMCPALPERLHPAVEELVLRWWQGPLRPVEGMAELIEELKGLGYGIYLLSNASVKLHEYFSRIPGSQFFDGLVVSADHLQLKPEREIYQTLFTQFHLKPEECFFIDDLYINIEGARFAGMDGAIFYGSLPELRADLRAAGIPVE